LSVRCCWPFFSSLASPKRPSRFRRALPWAWSCFHEVLLEECIEYEDTTSVLKNTVRDLIR
jgi:hypothetical protein